MVSDLTWNVIETDMRGLAARFQAVAGNLANSDTPGYVHHSVSFEEELRDALAGGSKLELLLTDSVHIANKSASVKAVAVREQSDAPWIFSANVNGVDAEKEMVLLAETRMMYGAMSRFAAQKASLYRTAVTGR